MKHYQKNQNLGLKFQQEIQPIIKNNFYFLLRYSLKNKEKGSLLIRIFIYLIISGFLVAIALPRLLPGCVGKNREADGKYGVGILNSSQEAYHFKTNFFAFNIQELAITLPNSEPYHYNFFVEVTPTVAYAFSFPKNSQKHGIRSFSGATFFDKQKKSYQKIICVTNGIVEKPTKPILKNFKHSFWFSNSILTCPQNMTEIK